MYCLLWKSQHLWLLFNKQYLNSSRITPKRVKTKKRKNETWSRKRKRSFSRIQTAPITSEKDTKITINYYSLIDYDWGESNMVQLDEDWLEFIL